MRKGIALVIILIAGLILGPLWAGNTGYVLISALGWTIELSLVAAIILLLLAIIILRAVWRFVARIVRGTQWGMRWFGQRRETKAANAYQEGLNHLLSGDYRAASAAFNRTWQLRKHSSDALLACYAAQQHGDLKQAQDWLAKVDRADELELARTILSLRSTPELSGQHLTVLNELVVKHPQHPELLRLALKALQRHHRWTQLIELLPNAQRLEALSATDLDALTEQAYYEVFVEQGRSSSGALKQFWQNLNRDTRRQPAVRRAYVTALHLFNEYEAAGKVVARGLKRNELKLPNLIEASLLKPSTELRDYLQDALKKDGDNPFLLHALGQLAFQTGDYALAQRALRKAAELAPSTRVQLDLARNYEAQGDTAGAVNAYREAWSKN
ncbi:hypothetical protein C9940_04135 [Pseudidiomarina aestuarii]|uniref:HemY N-terminal domain-containing protein n=1 Tax=Pseudidiomarina aestuarii TaxID=624146 RepID=A0A2T4CWR8_9GAMM|nr:hypothetical protein C9940_04135 [Pseudidiomarina aestuarii]